MLFRIVFYSLLLFIATTIDSSLGFSIPALVSGTEMLSNKQFYCFVGIVAFVEFFINFTWLGKSLLSYFYTALTAIKVVVIVGLISSAAYAKSVGLDGATDKLKEKCADQDFQKACELGQEYITGSLSQITQFL